MDSIRDVEHLEEMLSEPTPAAIAAMKRLRGDLIVLGVGGKMGPTLARMALRASQDAGVKRKIIGVSRFTNAEQQQTLDALGIETIKCDLLNQKELDRLPDAPSVIYMAGMKFGATGNESLTWAMNTYLPGMVSARYRDSKIVAFSTGNVYGLTSAQSGGSTETDSPAPIGEYAMSCLGRERIFEHFSRTLHIPTALIRLNYACEVRYGVLVDIAQNVWSEKPVDVTMGHFNVIWQGDASAMTLAAFDAVSVPPFVLNIAGPEILSIRETAQQFGKLMTRTPKLIGTEQRDALISNGRQGHRLYRKPRYDAQQMMRWIADWVMRGGETLGKPTHFESVDGKY